MLEFLKKIIQSDSKESSKRLIAVWAMTLASIVVLICIYKQVDLVTLLSLLLTFVLSISGVATYQSIKNKRDEDKN